jgi:hypothetical protein
VLLKTTPGIGHLQRGVQDAFLWGVNIENFDVQNFVLGNFHVKLKLKNKDDNFE